VKKVAWTSITYVRDETDDADIVLLKGLGDRLLSTVLRTKQGDIDANALGLCEDAPHQLEDNALERLGQILGQAKHLKKIECGTFLRRGANFDRLLSGIGHNMYLEQVVLRNVNLGGDSRSDKLRYLEPFLMYNTHLEVPRLNRCNLDQTALELISNALMHQSGGKIRDVSLEGNPLGDVNLDPFLLALSNQKHLCSINLHAIVMGKNGCTSLAKLFHQGTVCPLRKLELGMNHMNDAAVDVLLDTLARNPASSKLEEFILSWNHIVDGWATLLKFVCNSASIDCVIESNLALGDAGVRYIMDVEVEGGLGVRDANLLRACLDANKRGGLWGDDPVRRKIIWCHARGDFNVGNSTFPAGALPRILAWVGGGTDDDTMSSSRKRRHYDSQNRDHIQYLEEPYLLSETTVGIMRLDSFYRIVRIRPQLCCSPKGLAPSVSDGS